MTYTDVIFILLLAAAWLGSLLLRPWPAAKEWMLIGFSLVLIATWGYYDLVLFLAILLANFAGTRVMARAGRDTARIVLGVLIAADLGALAFFKYANFLDDNLRLLFGWAPPHFPLGIPLAISFYTFHLVSYLVDLHAGKTRPASFREYLFYLSFFPHVIAGPIVRAWQLIPQIGKIRRARGDVAMGLHYLIVGFCLKAVAANNIAEGIDPVWSGSIPLSTVDHWVVAFLYYCQIYGDFAGYSLMALGMARLMGYRLPPNFRAPMLAFSLREFWQRWHITLSRWLRDYVYIPLGGNRVSGERSMFNVVVTMLLGGLWHGAGWGFVAWGLMHGVGLAWERLRRYSFSAARIPGGLRVAWEPLAASAPSFRAWLATQAWVLIAWVFFRSPDLSAALHFVGGMLWPFRHHSYLLHRAVAFPLPFALVVLAHHTAPFWLRTIPRRRLGFILGIVTALALLVNIVVASPAKTFIYFRF